MLLDAYSNAFNMQFTIQPKQKLNNEKLILNILYLYLFFYWIENKKFSIYNILNN